MAVEQAILYGYRLSSCSWRVRAALQLKRIPFEERSVDIVRARTQLTEEYRAINPAQKVPALVIAALQLKRIPFEERSVDIVRARTQLTEEYRAINPAQKVPALVIDGVTLTDSMAIIGYLEDTRPSPELIPKSPLLKARMAEICQTIASGIQPLQNIGLKPYFGQDESYLNFSKHWCDRGLQTLEQLLGRTAGSHCLGDQLTVADLCLVPQIFNAETRLALDIRKYQTVFKLYETLSALKVFKETHPN